MSTGNEMAYVARKACGCITLIVMEGCREAGKEVGKAIKAGETVDRWTLDQVRSVVSLRCPEHPRLVKTTRAPRSRQGALL